MLELRPAGEHDRELADALFRRSAALPEEGLGYPRPDGVAGWDAEASLYDLSFEDATLVVCAGGQRVGVTGFLWEREADSAWVLGPLVVPQYRERVAEVLELLEADERFRVLRLCARVSNERLHDVAASRGWTLGPLQLEVKRDRRPEDNSLPDTDVHEVLPGDAEYERAVRLLKANFDWDGDHDGYQLLSSADGRAAGMWGIVRAGVPFARLEYLAVEPDARRSGLAQALIGEVVFRAAVSGAASVCLSLDPANEAARRLYEKCGFTETVYVRTFSWNRPDVSG